MTTLPSDYRVLETTSIFSRDRRTSWVGNRPTVEHPRETRPARVYTPVLIGVLLQDDGSYVAFIADPGSGNILPVRVGDSLPNNAGTVISMTLDYIETAPGADKPQRHIAIGQNILGGAAEFPSSGESAGSYSSEPSAPPAAPSASPSSPPPSGDVNSIIEQMKRRRMQQLGK